MLQTPLQNYAQLASKSQTGVSTTLGGVKKKSPGSNTRGNRRSAQLTLDALQVAQREESSPREPAKHATNKAASQ